MKSSLTPVQPYALQPSRFALAWMMATSLGLVCGFVLSTIIIFQLLDPNIMTVHSADNTWNFADGAIVGLTIGLSQWLILRRRLPATAWWIIPSVVGWSISLAPAFLELSVFLLGFMLMTLGQWLVLQRSVSRSGLWIILHLGSMIAGVIAVFLGGFGSAYVLGFTDHGIGQQAGNFGILFGSLLYGFLMGRSLNYLMQHPRNTNPIAS